MSIQKFIERFSGEFEEIDQKISEDTYYTKLESWDSLTAMSIQVMIEDQYGKTIKADELNNFDSIKALYNYIESQ